MSRLPEALRRRPTFFGGDPLLAGLWLVLVILLIVVARSREAFFFGVLMLSMGPVILRRVVERDPLRAQVLVRSLRWRHFYRARPSAWKRSRGREEFRL